MFAGVPGWDLPSGDLKKVSPGGNLSQQPDRCAAACDQTKGCVAFTIYVNNCFLKRNSGNTATYTEPASSAKWRWMYYHDSVLPLLAAFSHCRVAAGVWLSVQPLLCLADSSTRHPCSRLRGSVKIACHCRIRIGHCLRRRATRDT
jgi:hypothetical protein